MSCSYRQDGFSNLSLISRHSDVTLKFPQICIECPFEDSFGGRIVIVALRWGRWQLLWGKIYTFWKEAEHLDDFKGISASNQTALLPLILHNANEAEHLATKTDPNYFPTL